MRIMTINNNLSNTSMKGSLSELKNAVSHGKQITQKQYDTFINLIPKTAEGRINKLNLDKEDNIAFNKFFLALRNFSAKNKNCFINIQELTQLLKNNIIEEENYNGKQAEVTRDNNGWPVSIKTEAETKKMVANYLGLNRSSQHVDEMDWNNNIWASPIQRVWDGTKQDYFVWDSKMKMMRFLDGEWAPRRGHIGFHYKNNNFSSIDYRLIATNSRLVPDKTYKPTLEQVAAKTMIFGLVPVLD